MFCSGVQFCHIFHRLLLLCLLGHIRDNFLKQFVGGGIAFYSIFNGDVDRSPTY